MSEAITVTATPVSYRDIIAAAFDGKPHPQMQTAEQNKARKMAEHDRRFPVLADLMAAGGGRLVGKPGSYATCWVPNSEIRYLHTLETLGELRDDRPNGRAVYYNVCRFDITPAGRRILERNGLL